MGHTFDPENAHHLEDESRYRHVSVEELLTALSAHAGATVADLGSGTGFYTDAVAPRVGRCLAVDVQEAMHDRYREKGVPDGVELVTAGVADLPFDDGEVDAAFSTMTFHEFVGADALAELRRVLAPGARLVTFDWSRHGACETGPSRDHRVGLGEAVTALSEASFTVVDGAERTETFHCVAVSQ
jgi:ubiquinone/menaquinone biosynthesis C-methylase UbiE